MLKRLFLRMSVLALFLLLPLAASAITPEDSARLEGSTLIASEKHETNAYEQVEGLRSLQNTSIDELLSQGLTSTQIREIKDYSLESALYERSKLPAAELKKMGYTDDVISILQDYQGEPITAESDVLRAVPTVSGELDFYRDSDNQFTIYYDWSWSQQPIDYFTDAAGLVFQASCTGSSEATCVVSYANCNVYYTELGGGNTNDIISFPVTPGDSNVFNGRGSTFPVRKYAGWYWEYAYKGYMIVTLRSTGGDRINYIQAYGAYGHSSFSATPSISFGAGPSLSFSPTYSIVKMGVALDGGAY